MPVAKWLIGYIHNSKAIYATKQKKYGTDYSSSNRKQYKNIIILVEFLMLQKIRKCYFLNKSIYPFIELRNNANKMHISG